MIRVVLDTNTVISGTLWSGTPHKVMEAARSGIIKPVVCEEMLDELKDVLGRKKFSRKLETLEKTPNQIVTEYAQIADVIQTPTVIPRVSVDMDDDIFIACAVVGMAMYVISGDPHLLDIVQHETVKIVTAAAFLKWLSDNNPHY